MTYRDFGPFAEGRAFRHEQIPLIHAGTKNAVRFALQPSARREVACCGVLILQLAFLLNLVTLNVYMHCHVISRLLLNEPAILLILITIVAQEYSKAKGWYGQKLHCSSVVFYIRWYTPFWKLAKCQSSRTRQIPSWVCPR